jgi:ankyrin repeat protein
LQLFCDFVGGGELEDVKVLLELKADVNIVNRKGAAPIHSTFNEGIIELLVANGANVNSQDLVGRTSLHLHCDNPWRLKGVKALLKSKADVNIVDRKGAAPIHLARDDPIHFARDEGMIALLVANRANVNSQDDAGRTPLHLHCEGGRLEHVKVLLELKADVNIVDRKGAAPIHLTRNGRIAALLVANMANVNSQDDAGSTPLHLHCEGGRLEDVRVLLELKADVNIVDRKGAAPIHLARDEGIIALLAANGANVNSQDDAGSTPFHNLSSGC